MQQLVHKSKLFSSALFFQLCLLACCSRSVAQTSAKIPWQSEFNAGNQAFKQNDLGEAMRRFKEVTRRAPGFAQAHLNLGIVDERLGDYAEAISELRRALTLKPGLRGGEFFAGIAFFKQKKYAEAKQSLLRELKTDSKNAQVLKWLGLTQISLGEYAEAANRLDSAVTEDPKNVDLLYFAGHAHLLASQNTYERMYTIDPDSWRVHEILAQAYSEANRSQDAVTEYKEAIKRAPTEPQLHYWLAGEYENIGNPAAAIAAYQEELVISPDSYEAMQRLGIMEMQNEKLQDGIEMLKAALRGDPSLVSTYFYLGLAEDRAGDPTAAQPYLEMATKVETDHDRLQRSYYLLAQVYRALRINDKYKEAMAKFEVIKNTNDAEDKRRLSDRIRKHQDQSDGDITGGGNRDH